MNPNTSCPMCGATAVVVLERLNDAVVVFGCEDCSATWADRMAPEEQG